MAKYGLQRGVDGSLAKHMSTSEYYKDLMGKQESLQSNIDVLLEQQEELNQQLKDTKTEVHKQKRENAVNEATAAIATKVGALFGSDKLKDTQSENKALKEQILKDKQEIADLKEAHSKELVELNGKHSQEKAAMQKRINDVSRFFPEVPLLMTVAYECRNIGLSDKQARDVVNFRPVQYTGKLYCREYRKYIHAEDVTISVSRGQPGGPHFLLQVDGKSLMDWFLEQLRKLREVMEKTRSVRKVSRGLGR